MAKETGRRPEASAALEQERARLALALRASKIGIWEWDITSDALIWDSRMYELYGLDPEKTDNVYEMWAQAVHPDDSARAFREIELAVSGEKQFSTEFRIVLPGDEIRHIRATGDVVFDADGKPLRMIGANWDISREKQDEQLVQSTLEKLKASNRDLEQFAFAVAHDLQTPLRHISAFTEIIADKLRSPATYDDEGEMDIVMASSRRLGQMIDDLLAYSRVGRARLKLEEFSPCEVLRDVADLFAPELKERNASLNIADIPYKIRADRTQLTQLFQNLIGNALKYSADDRAPVISVVGTAQPSAWRFSVADNGIGIAEKNFEKIFAVFQRLHGTNRYEGTGIGLAICKKIADAHGGWISVESREGEGSVFHLNIPSDIGLPTIN